MPKSRGVNSHYKTGSATGCRSRRADPQSYASIPSNVISTAFCRITSNKKSFYFDTCLVSTYATNSSTTSGSTAGGPRIALQLNEIHYNLLCKVVYLLKNGELPRSSHDTASHLCGNPFCLNHCIWEPLATNVSRELCHSRVVVVTLKCEHTPCCIPRPDMQAVRNAIKQYNR